LGRDKSRLSSTQKPIVAVSIIVMRHLLRIIIIALAFTVPCCCENDIRLEPNASLSLEFPDLPETLATKFTGEKQPARLTAELPENYSSDGRFPIFIFLHGGHGGHGRPHPITREIAGKRDFICVTLPLFKQTFDPDEGALISMDDFALIGRAYRTMLQKLFETVPNITPERSTLGGFSNGAHTTAVLLAGHDEFILRHFRAFFFVEGASPLAANVLQKLAMKQYRFLVLYGDQSKGLPVREALILVSRSLDYSAKERQLDFTSIVMRGAGHELPPDYSKQIGLWLRGETLPGDDHISVK
jgi:predicted peptidase